VPARPRPPRIYLGAIPKGYAGTLRTLEHIKTLVKRGAKDFYVRQRAIDILIERGVAPKDFLGEIRALFEWVQAHVRYTRDPFRVEVLHSARRMLELAAGDCDDMTILLGALLESIGHPVRLVVVGPTPRRPDLFTHIYLEVRHRHRWIALDPTMPHPMGWAPRVVVKQVVSLDDGPVASPDLTLVEVGRLLGLIYRSPGRPGAPGHPCIHLMREPPWLMRSVDGRQLHIVGGRYRITGRGIEG
jgi:transglutaminase-like putative cysteine protease